LLSPFYGRPKWFRKFCTSADLYGKFIGGQAEVYDLENQAMAARNIFSPFEE
jgi:hypothetical protein